jgi:BirA family biotin operon repressor/biotin-[acetyl-CoA-carboxylase] ligase
MREPLPSDFASALRATAGRRGSIGEPSWFFVETASTNDEAVKLAEEGAPQGSTVVASAQTAGRGRLGRAWYSPPGAGLYVSVVLRDVRLGGLVTLAAGIAVAEGIRVSTGLPVEIKWPNDVVVGTGTARARRLKLAGILAEASTGSEGLHYVILGFGINVRKTPFPPALSEIATSIEGELGRAIEPAAVFGETLVALNSQVQLLTAGDTAAILNRWRALAPTSVGAAIEWDRAPDRTRGTTAGIDEHGALLARTGNRTERILSGEVRWL